MTKLIGIGEFAISDNETEILSAPNLGSCLGISIYDPRSRRGAMIHCMLPMSKSNPEKAEDKPTMYVDTGLVMVLQELLSKGANKKELIIAVAGGSNINDTNNVFEIGKKNYTILKKVLWKNGLLLKGEHVGSSISRTISLHVGTGEVFVKTGGETTKLV